MKSANQSLKKLGLKKIQLKPGSFGGVGCADAASGWCCSNGRCWCYYGAGNCGPRPQAN